MKQNTCLRFPAAMAILLSGCSVGLLGDAEAACERIETAIAAHEEKCNLVFRGLPDCEGIVMGASGGKATDCEERLASLACGEALPDECRWNGF